MQISILYKTIFEALKLANPSTAGMGTGISTNTNSVEKKKYTKEEIEAIRKQNRKAGDMLKEYKKSRIKKMGLPENYDGPVKADLGVVASIFKHARLIPKSAREDADG